MNAKYTTDINTILQHSEALREQSRTEGYFWFLSSLNTAIENEYCIEIMGDHTGEATKYKIQDYTLNLSNIERIEYPDNRAFEYNKYYVYTSNGRYRFLAYLRK